MSKEGDKQASKPAAASQNRKARLAALFGGEEGAEDNTTASAQTTSTQSAPSPTSAPQAQPAPARKPSGAVKAMGLSLGQLGDELAKRQATPDDGSERVEQIDTALIDGSFIADRLTGPKIDGQSSDPFLAVDEDLEALIESIRENGQQVPVLLRPHPQDPKRYQAVYGHRRIIALKHLGQPVRAIVRSLSDRELILAQGQENALRRNLSFVEKAQFTQALLESGFDRHTVMAALGLHKAEVSRLVQVAEALPTWLIMAIGPAPKAGRARWMALADRSQGDSAEERARDLFTQDRFANADSDGRFQLAFNALAKPSKSARAKAAQTEIVRDDRGIELARFQATGKNGAAGTLRFPEPTPAARRAGVDDGFAAFVAAQLPDLVQRYRERRSDDAADE